MHLESKLNQILESDLIAQLKQYDIFDILNQEKITPNFVKLAKLGQIEANLEDICKNDGTPFQTEQECNEHILNYYSNLNKKQTTPIDTPTIAEFLGPNIVNSPQVLNAKLTHEIKEQLKLDISLTELNKAISECKVNTASGLDGVNYAFLTKFWATFCTPLHK